MASKYLSISMSRIAILTLPICIQLEKDYAKQVEFHLFLHSNSRTAPLGHSKVFFNTVHPKTDPLITFVGLICPLTLCYIAPKN